MKSVAAPAQISYISKGDDGLLRFDFEADDRLFKRISRAVLGIPSDALRDAGLSDLQCYRPVDDAGTAREILDIVLSEGGVFDGDENDPEVEALRGMVETLDARCKEAQTAGLVPRKWSLGFVWEEENAFGQNFAAHPDDKAAALAFADALEGFAERQGIAEGFFIEDAGGGIRPVNEALDAVVDDLEGRLKVALPALRAVRDQWVLEHSLPGATTHRKGLRL